MTQEDDVRRAPRTAWSTAFRVLGATAVMAGLAACAGEAPQIPATEEAAQYRAHAHNYYQPPGPAWDPWGPYVVEASRRFDVPESWIRAVMHQESDGQEFAVSTPGAMGLMQIMPFTYDLMREQYGLGEDAYDPHNNVLAGVAYIRQMYDIYGSPGFLAAYNAGPGRLDDFLTRNRPLPAETRHYVASIGPQIAFESPRSRSAADLMAMNHAHGEYGGAPSGPPVDPSLTHSVQLAWARRTRGEEEEATEVAEAQPSAEPIGFGRRSVGSYGAASASAVRAAWARRADASVSVASNDAQATVASNDAQAVVASNGAQPGAAVASRFAPAPTPAQASAPVDAEPASPAPATTEAVRLASARLASAPSPELADSVAEAPDAQPVRAGRRLRFRLVSPAYADTIPYGRATEAAPVAGHWAIQVGAFGTMGAAHEAAGSAMRSEGLLGRAHPEFATLRDRRGHLYRARVAGLSREAATRACAHLGRASCIVVSPDGA